ncbi:hypothetical protein [Clostridium sp. CF012]|uniref:hypothetical protein n=1 Tax=Clostridium sp. CF012 TaxID=2843319 RepID=UPI001C0DBF3B|nr:hypothetical protein [Clostridium sp. CF012]MBU3146061.1 hypothetical protein [Clostridium sp. CF012]
MKKIMLIIAVLVITSIAIIFSKNIKAFIQGENQSLNKNIYNFLEDVGNQKNIYGAAIDLNKESSANTCVYFIAEVLRRNDFNVPKGIGNIAQMIAILEEEGWQKQRDYKNLMPGDICFTTDGNGDKNGIPTHTYVFMKWVKEGNYDYAYICDNKAKDYKGNVYHIRNINVVARSNGFDKEAFAFFMN